MIFSSLNSSPFLVKAVTFVLEVLRTSSSKFLFVRVSTQGNVISLRKVAHVVITAKDRKIIDDQHIRC